MSRCLRLLVGAIVLSACSSTPSKPVADFTPADLLDMAVDMFGVVADIPHRQYLGETSAAGDNQFPTVYRWLAELTLLDRGSTDVQVSVQDLQAARISIARLYDVRLTVDWQLYDTETESMVFTGSSDGFARGKNLGFTGMRPNVMLDSFQNCLGRLIGQDEFAAAIAAAGVPG